MAQAALVGGAAALNMLGGIQNANAQIAQGKLDARALNINAAASDLNASMFEQQAVFSQMLAERNATVLEATAGAVTQIGKFNARAARDSAAAEANRQDILTQKFLGKQRSLYGKAGVLTSGGSPLEVLEETAEEGEIEKLMLLREGELTAMSALFDSQLQAGNLRAQAGIARFEGATSRFLGESRANIARFESAKFRFNARAGLAGSRFLAKNTLITSAFQSGSMLLSGGIGRPSRSAYGIVSGGTGPGGPGNS